MKKLSITISVPGLKRSELEGTKPPAQLLSERHTRIQLDGLFSVREAEKLTKLLDGFVKASGIKPTRKKVEHTSL